MEEALSGSVGKRESKARLEREETSSLTLRDRVGHLHKRSHRKQLDSLQICRHRATVLCNRYKTYLCISKFQCSSAKKNKFIFFLNLMQSNLTFILARATLNVEVVDQDVARVNLHISCRPLPDRRL